MVILHHAVATKPRLLVIALTWRGVEGLLEVPCTMTIEPDISTLCGEVRFSSHCRSDIPLIHAMFEQVLCPSRVVDVGLKY